LVLQVFRDRSDQITSQQFQQISATELWFSVLAPHFLGKSAPVSFTQFSQRVRPTPLENPALTAVSTLKIPEFRSSTFCFCKRFALTIAVQRLERATVLSEQNARERVERPEPLELLELASFLTISLNQ
jgi:hypothetical protein